MNLYDIGIMICCFVLGALLTFLAGTFEKKKMDHHMEKDYNVLNPINRKPLTVEKTYTDQFGITWSKMPVMNKKED